MSAPIRLSGPVPPRPRFLGLRLAFWEVCEFFTIVYGPPGPGWRASTLRWTQHNHDLPRRCACGAPGTSRVIHRPAGHPSGACGDEPPWSWRCEEHAEIPLTVPWTGGKPLIGQTREECSWNTSRNVDGLIRECGCGTHVGEQADQWKVKS